MRLRVLLLFLLVLGAGGPASAAMYSGQAIVADRARIAGRIPDPPVPGALAFVAEALEVFRVAILSNRSSEPEGICRYAGMARGGDARALRDELQIAARVLSEIEWPTQKPPAFVTIDDRAIIFTGTWPGVEELRAFRPWNRR